MQRLKLFLPLVVFAAVAAFFFVMMNRIDSGEYNPKSMPSALLNKPFPEFSLSQLEQPGNTLHRELVLGKIAIVNVWATWCPGCHIEHPYLNVLARERNVIIFGVNYKDQAPAALKWLADKGNPYQFNIFDPLGDLVMDLGVTGAPETYLIDHRGFIRYRYQGPLNEAVWSQRFMPLIEQLEREQQSDQGVAG